MKERSCGFLISYDGKFLLVKSSGGNIWGIPKGVKEKGESDLEAALRELKEETGLDLSGCFSEDMRPFMQYSTKRKNFVVFRSQIIPDEFHQELKCSTLLDNGEPEIDAFAWVDKKSALVLTKSNHTRQIFENV